MVLDFVVIVVGLLALVWSADQFVEGAAAIAGSVGMPPLLIGMTIVPVGTSAPEILVSLMAAIAGSGELAVGNALGSNIANIGLVLGITPADIADIGRAYNGVYRPPHPDRRHHTLWGVTG